MSRTLSHELLTTVLQDVSRSFYLTLRVLPNRIRSQIGLAYLLARTTDTIADTGLVPLDQRLRALEHLRERVLKQSTAPLDFRALQEHQGSRAEQVLLERAEETLGLLEQLTQEDRALIQQVIGLITSGQELDLRRFAGGSKEHVAALTTAQELDDYTYRVAGCVGEFWTRICRAHLFPNAPLDEDWLISQGIRFGKGLQLVNVLRDLPSDLRQGRCYMPTQRLSSIQLVPEQLLSPEVERQFRPLYNEYLGVARNHLLAGSAYTRALPWKQMRVRLACAWPLLIGFDTLELLSKINSLAPAVPRKVSRRHVKRAMWRSVILYPVPQAWNRLVDPGPG